MTTTDTAQDDARFEALARREPAADGGFFYGVRSTGIYCRPTCGARRPRRENVVFFESWEMAQRKGFRPCQRCRPDGPTLEARQAEEVIAACRALEAEEAPDLATLAGEAGMSPHHFHRVFKRLTGMTPKAYSLAKRAERVRRALPGGESVTEALYAAGYPSGGRFYAESAARLGMAPKRFRQGGPGETIRFAVGECPLGSVLVASTVRGLCAVFLGNDPDALVRELQDRFPRAALIGGDADYEQLVARVISLVEAPGTAAPELPLDIRGTAFQQRVWEALRGIPPGTTVSYTELAQRIGSPSAVRAVAGACAANAHAVLIPCHRVVRQNGDLSGYRWGVERKAALLAREQELIRNG